MAGKSMHKWAFKPGMRAGAYSWKSSAKAIERLKLTSAEIRAVARGAGHRSRTIPPLPWQTFAPPFSPKPKVA
ncbi:MAG: hypothetical protein Q8P60_09285 [Pseudorhodobacter sp.]|nr:hypothetical protein [Pseudorhodobacter sp.]